MKFANPERYLYTYTMQFATKKMYITIYVYP